MEIKNLTFSKATIELGYEELSILKDAMNLYYTAAKMQYSDKLNSYGRIKRSLDDLNFDMTENLKEEFK